MWKSIVSSKVAGETTVKKHSLTRKLINFTILLLHFLNLSSLERHSKSIRKTVCTFENKTAN